jgi:hypothetical protein
MIATSGKLLMNIGSEPRWKADILHIENMQTVAEVGTWISRRNLTSN